MINTETTETKSNQSSSQNRTPEKATSPLEVKLIEDTNRAIELPLPESNKFWDLSVVDGIRIHKRRLFPFLKKKELTEADLSQLRDIVERSPGRAKTQIQELLKDNTGNADLMMLFSVCSYRMVMNSSNRKGILEGLKNATRDAAKALLSDGISPHNCVKFFEIYFEYLNRLKRFQISTYKALGETIRQHDMKKKLEVAIKKCDSLLEENKRVVKVLNLIKGKFKSSSFNTRWELNHIRLAGKKVEQSDFRYMCGQIEARQLVVNISALLDVFARVPILTPLVESLLNLIPEGAPELYLRKVSIQSRRAFTQFSLLVKEGNRDRLRTLGRQIYKNNVDYLKQISGHLVKQTFEADPYFNVSRITIMTFGLFKAEEQSEMLQKSANSIKQLKKLDISKTKVYSQMAEKIETKLSTLLVETGNAPTS